MVREGLWNSSSEQQSYGFRELRIDYGLFLNKGSCIVAASNVRRWLVIGTGVIIVDDFTDGIVIDA